MPLHNDERVSGKGGAVAAAAAAGDRSIIRTARFVIMIAMLMMELLLQLKALSYYSCCRRTDPGRLAGSTTRFLSPIRIIFTYKVCVCASVS